MNGQMTRFGTLSRDSKSHFMKEARAASKRAHEREAAAAKAERERLRQNTGPGAVVCRDMAQGTSKMGEIR